MSWLLFVFINIFSLGSVSVLQRSSLRTKNSDPVAYGVLFQLTIAFLLYIFSIFTIGFTLPDLAPIALPLFLMTVFFTIYNLLIFKAYKLTEASEIAVILATNSLWAIASSLLVLGEVINFKQILGATLIVLGVIVITLKKKRIVFSIGHIYTLIAAIFFGLGFTTNVYIVKDFESVSSFLVLAFLFPGLGLLFIRPKALKNIGFYFKGAPMLKITLASSIFAIAAITSMLAYKYGGKASIIAPMSQSSILVTVLLSYILLNERDNILKKLAGSTLVLIGLVLLV